MKVIIVGAGIGGLTLANALQDRHEITVLERTSAIGEVGAGIQMSPNGSRVLHSLGLAQALRDVGMTPTRGMIRRWDNDRELLTSTIGHAMEERFGAPYLNLYRPDLISILLSALRNTEIKLESTVVGVTHAKFGAEVGAEVALADGSTMSADVVVGADGIHSAVRTALYGQQPSRFSEYVAYRALVPGTLVADLVSEATNRVGPDQHLVSYFVGRDRRFLNLVAIVREPGWDIESWTEPGSVDALRLRFVDWSPEVNAVLGLVSGPIYRWALHDRTPLQRWSEGHVTLLGDACHPMLPFMAQGACQAIEDAAVLARCLDNRDSTVPGALRSYEEERRPRTSDIQRRSWQNCTTYHLPDGPDQQARDEVFTAISQSGNTMAPFNWLYGHDALAEPTQL